MYKNDAWTDDLNLEICRPDLYHYDRVRISQAKVIYWQMLLRVVVVIVIPKHSVYVVILTLNDLSEWITILRWKATYAEASLSSFRRVLLVYMNRSPADHS